MHKSGRKVKDICQDLGSNRNTFFYLKQLYTGTDSLQLKRLKELEEENAV